MSNGQERIQREFHNSRVSIGGIQDCYSRQHVLRYRTARTLFEEIRPICRKLERDFPLTGRTSYINLAQLIRGKFVSGRATSRCQLASGCTSSSSSDSPHAFWG